MFHLAINRVQSGPFSEDEVRQRAARGEFGTTDLCWREGWPQWRRIAEVFPPAAEPPPLPTTPPALPSGAPARAAARSVPYATGPVTSGLAVASLVCGVGVFVLFPFFFLLAPAAVILGHLAKARIRRSAGKTSGAGLATAGLISGYIGGGLMLAGVSAIAFFVLNEARQNSQDAEVRDHLARFWTEADRQLRENDAAEATYDQLVGEGKPLDEADLMPVAGEDYRGIVVKRGDDWVSITLGDGRTVSYYAANPAAAPIMPEIEAEEDVSPEEPESAKEPSEPEPTPDASDIAPAAGPETRSAAPALL